ncbi:GNAT family acetyltransferase, partial [Pseudomonas coronafaciens pv. garcae]
MSTRNHLAGSHRMGVHIDINNNPTEEDRLAILEPLKRFNAEQAGDGKSEKIAIFIRDDETQEVLGGLHMRILFEWLFIELLVVPEQVRGQGMG